MKFIGIGKKSTKAGKTILVAEFTEAEADMITGVAGRPHISGRYKPGIEVNIAKIYQKVKTINEKHDAIKQAVTTIKSRADDISNALPLT